MNGPSCTPERNRVLLEHSKGCIAANINIPVPFSSVYSSNYRIFQFHSVPFTAAIIEHSIHTVPFTAAIKEYSVPFVSI